MAKCVREVLNGLLGDRAVPLPTTWAPPYDLHLKKKEDQVDRTRPSPSTEAEGEPWVTHYLSSIPAAERRSDLAPRGALAKGRVAIALAKTGWAGAHGQAEVVRQAPYRAFRRNDRWVVLGQGLDRKLGEGLVLVVEASSGQVIRIAQGASPP